MRKRISITLLVLAACALGIITAVSRQAPQRGPFPSYTATFHFESKDFDGKLLDSETQVRWQNSAGMMHETRDSQLGRHEDDFGDPRRGIFMRKGDKLFGLGKPYQPVTMTMADLRSTPGYVRDDTVLGVETAVMETPRVEGQAWQRLWIAPSLGGLLLKSEIHADHSTIYKEAVSLDLKEPSRPAPPIPALPVERALTPGAPTQ